MSFKRIDGGYIIEHGDRHFDGGVRIMPPGSFGWFVPKNVVVPLSKALAEIMAKQADDEAAAARAKNQAELYRGLETRRPFWGVDKAAEEKKTEADRVAEHYRAHLHAQPAAPAPKPQPAAPKLYKVGKYDIDSSIKHAGLVSIYGIDGLRLFYVTPDTAETIAHTIAYFQDPAFSIVEAVTKKVHAVRIASDIEVTRKLLEVAKQARERAPKKPPIVKTTTRVAPGDFILRSFSW